MLEIINLAQIYGCRPSHIVGLEEPYEAFCFDEACAFIKIQIDNGENPKFKKINDYNKKDEYIKNDCAYGCKYFVLEKINNGSK